MEIVYRYFIIVSIAIAVFYILHKLIFSKERNFKLSRIYIIGVLLISLLLPINRFTLSYSSLKSGEQLLVQSYFSPFVNNNGNKQTDFFEKNNSKAIDNQSNTNNTIILGFSRVFLSIYLIVCCLLLVRLIFSIGKILYFYFHATKIKTNYYTIILLDKRIVPFSFFRWIFVDNSMEEEELKQIIEHEKIHADQCHTVDLLFLEILGLMMWFNPFVWLFKKALQQIHEFLADEGILNSGINKLQYLSLIVNQAAEERLVAVSSNFSYSLIKKRIMMMSKKRTKGRTEFKLLILLPIIAILLLSISAFNEPKKEDPKNLKLAKTENKTAHKVNNEILVIIPPKVKSLKKKEQTRDTIPDKEIIAVASPTKMNVLYIGLDNPVSIAVSGVSADKVTVEINNGSITGENGKYIVRPKGTGKSIITIKVDNQIVSIKEFRNKRVPDPIARIAGPYSNLISTQDLISAGKLETFMPDFDFDLKFGIVGFTMSTVVDGGVAKESKQENGDKFTPEQIELIKQVKSDGRIYFEDILIKAPDGRVRNLGPIAVKIK